MKENSEEDIKNIEEVIELSKEEIDAKDENITAILDIEDLVSLEHILSDYKRLLKENEELKIKNNAIKRESEAYAENMIRLDNELNLEKEKSKYVWIRQNCLPQELVNKLYIPIQKVKDKIEELNKKINKSIDNSKGGLDEEFIEKAGELLAQKRILQELLESEE